MITLYLRLPYGGDGMSEFSSWCIENGLKGVPQTDRTVSDFTSMTYITPLVFQTDQDAVLFKLRWGDLIVDAPKGYTV